MYKYISIFYKGEYSLKYMEKKNLFSFFMPKSITKDDEFAEIPTNFKGFFVMYGRKFWNLSNLNLVYVLCNIPFFFLIFALAGFLNEKAIVVSSPMLSAFYGLETVAFDGSLSSIFPFVNSYAEASVPSVGTYICYGISALTIFTFGLSNIGAAYCIRGYVRGEPIFVFSEFFSSIKKNFLQGLIIGVIDIVFSFVLIWDYLFWNGQSGFINGIFMYFSLFLCVLYFFMRFYIYTIAITFDLSVYKIFKDAFLLSFLGFKRNIIALLGIILVIALSFQIFFILPSAGIMLPVIITLATLMFISGYASYPVIKKYMIDPFYPDYSFIASDDNEDFDNDEAVFEDRG